MLDDYTRAACRHAEKMATQNGWDLYETLERAGLLLTKEKRTMVEVAALSALLVQLEDQQSFVLAGFGGDQSITGAVKGVLKFIELFARNLQA